MAKEPGHGGLGESQAAGWVKAIADLRSLRRQAMAGQEGRLRLRGKYWSGLFGQASRLASASAGNQEIGKTIDLSGVGVAKLLRFARAGLTRLDRGRESARPDRDRGS